MIMYLWFLTGWCGEGELILIERNRRRNNENKKGNVNRSKIVCVYIIELIRCEDTNAKIIIV